MSLYAIGDLHLCLGAYKPMDVFGGRWEGYMEKLREGLSVIAPGDTTVLLGDLSWALGIEQAEKDFAFLHEIPGRKIILKGNHDYWWTTATKFYHFCAARGWDDMFILNNNCYFYGETALCGTRGWFYEQEQEGTHDEKIFRRELGRLEASLKAVPGDSRAAGALRGPAVLLRASARREHASCDSGKLRRLRVPTALRRLCKLQATKTAGLKRKYKKQ